MSRTKSDAERTNRVVLIAGGLGTIGLGADFAAGSSVAPPTAVQLVSLATVAAIWIAAYARRRRPSLLFANVSFVVLNLALCVALWAQAAQIVESGRQWVPFRPHQLGALAVALLAPPTAWAGVASIFVIIGAAVLQFQLFSPAIHAQLPYGDPWATLFFGGFALVLLFYRHRADRIEREVVRAQSEAESYQRYARAMLAIRDLSNTPLQTLSNMIVLIRARGLEPQETVERLERTVARLTELEEATRPFEQALHWEAGDESFDPRVILKASVR